MRSSNREITATRKQGWRLRRRGKRIKAKLVKEQHRRNELFNLQQRERTIRKQWKPAP